MGGKNTKEYKIARNYILKFPNFVQTDFDADILRT
jgi:hypothetical protein